METSTQPNLTDMPYDVNFKHIWHDVIKEQHIIKNIVKRNIQALNGEEVLHWMRSKVCILFCPIISKEIEKLTCLKSGISIHPLVMFKNFTPKKNIREEEIIIRLSIFNDPCVDLNEKPRLDDLVLVYSVDKELIEKEWDIHCSVNHVLFPTTMKHGTNAKAYHSLDEKGVWAYFSKIYYSPKYDTICIEYVSVHGSCYWQFLVPETDPITGKIEDPEWKGTWEYHQAFQEAEYSSLHELEQHRNMKENDEKYNAIYS